MNYTCKKRYRGFTLVELLVVIAIIAALAGLAFPVIQGAIAHADRTTAISNGKQIHIALIQFEQDFGGLPDKSVRDANPGVFDNTPQGDDANSYLAMLIASNTIDSEKVFYAKGGSATNREPDDIFETSSRMLEAGENGFAYIMNQGDTALKTSGRSARPILAAALDPVSSDAEAFDKEVYKGKGVVIHLDGSASTPRLNDDGKARLTGTRKTLFDNGSETVWGDTKPVIKRAK